MVNVAWEHPASRAILFETLQRMMFARRYTRWMLEYLLPYAGDSVLEVGCGVGNLTPYFLQAQQVVSVDAMAEAVRHVRQRWGHHAHLVPLVGDITDAATVRRLSAYAFDTVVFVNVLEHIRDDDVALTHAFDLLQPGGHLLVYAPAHPGLFGSLDVSLGHYRRYTPDTLVRKVTRAGLTPLFCRRMNLLGVLGWWANGRLWPQPIIPTFQIRLFDLLVPLLRPAERALRAVWPQAPGLALVCVARREV